MKIKSVNHSVSWWCSIVDVRGLWAHAKITWSEKSGQEKPPVPEELRFKIWGVWRFTELLIALQCTCTAVYVYISWLLLYIKLVDHWLKHYPIMCSAAGTVLASQPVVFGVHRYISTHRKSLSSQCHSWGRFYFSLGLQRSHKTWLLQSQDLENAGIGA